MGPFVKAVSGNKCSALLTADGRVCRFLVGGREGGRETGEERGKEGGREGGGVYSLDSLLCTQV